MSFFLSKVRENPIEIVCAKFGCVIKKTSLMCCVLTIAACGGSQEASEGGSSLFSPPLPAQTSPATPSPGTGAPANPQPSATPQSTPAPPPSPAPSSSPIPSPSATPIPRDLNIIGSNADAARFLAFAAFGGSQEEIQQLVGRDAADWLREEMDKPATLLSPIIVSHRANGGNFFAPYTRFMNTQLIRTLFENDDQLRTRMTLALSQILVVGNETITNNFAPLRGLQYVDVLTANAFGNYRKLIEDVTFSPAMAEWLSYINNDRGDPASGRMPDENYARELLQLFTIGLVELNTDGTAVTRANGQNIELYNNQDIVNLARVFTGFSYQGRRFGANATASNRGLPIEIYDSNHSSLEKNFLNVRIPANTSGLDSLNMALDGIFAHPNVGPFICRQLIQRFTASNPAPDYVRRVVSAFDDGRYTSANGTRFGNGQRGDLEATLAAILLDQSIFSDPSSQTVSSGKIQEPLLSFARWVRTFKVANLDQAVRIYRLFNTGDVGSLQMRYFGSPSVFNFYRPGYVAPQSQSGGRSLTAPEFQIFDTTFFFGYANFMTDFVYEDLSIIRDCPPDSRFNGVNPCVPNGPAFNPDYSREIALANDPLALVDHLDTLLTGDRMLSQTRSAIVEAVESIDLNLGSSSEARQREQRAKTAIFMAISSPSFIVVQ